MKRILFICHGNICRSAAAEMVLKQMIRERGIDGVQVSSAAATREEIGNDIYPPMKKALWGRGYLCETHRARQTTKADYQQYDLLIGMDMENLWDMKRIYGGDTEKKISLLRDWAGEPGQEIDDPWYTRDFDGVLKQIEAGCRGILDTLGREKREDGAAGQTSAGREIQVAVLSDTHGMLRRQVVNQVRGCEAILHAGDIIRETDLDELSLYGSLYAVRGNNDVWVDGLRNLAGLLRFEIGGVSFLMTHERRDVPRDLEGVQVIVTGHTHRYSEEWIDGRLWINPGSCGRSRFGGEVTMARLLLRAGKIQKVQKIILDGE